MTTSSELDPNKIITEGKLDIDLYEDPVMVLVDLYNEVIHETETDLLLGDVSDIAHIDLIEREDPEFMSLDEEELKYDHFDKISQKFRFM